MESLFNTLDKLISWNNVRGDITGKVNNYYFILIQEEGKAVNPVRLKTSGGEKGLNVYPCIAYEVSDELNIWGIVVDKDLKPVWVDEHKDPLSLLKEHLEGRMPLVLKDNEVPGERVFKGDYAFNMQDNPFVDYPESDKSRVKELLSNYQLFIEDKN